MTPDPSAPFSPVLNGSSRPNVPPIGSGDQPPPPPERPRFDRAYHGYTFRTNNVPQTIGGWTVERARNAIEQHDLGYFWESSILSVACTRFPPIFAALRQRTAEQLGRPRRILGGSRGLARIVREEVEDQIAPAQGKTPSRYFPADLWGSTAASLAMMGFALHEHVYGDPLPDGTLPCFTRFWPTSAIQCVKYRRTYQALTMDGPVDIIPGDGKWSWFGTSDLPHYNGAVRAVGLEYLAGGFTDADMRSFANRYGAPKPLLTMPEGVGADTPEGDLMYAVARTITEPDSFGLLPYGADGKMLQVASAQTSIFTDIKAGNWMAVAAALLGSDGTMSKDTGVYPSPSLANAKYEIIRDDNETIVRGTNTGRIRPWAFINYGDQIAEKDVPYLDIPLPDADQDARTKSYGERAERMHSLVKGERDAGGIVTQERVNQIAESLNVEPFTLADAAPKGGEIYSYDEENGIVTINEVRARKDLPPKEWGHVTVPEGKARLAAGWTTSDAGWVPPGNAAEEEGADTSQAPDPPAEDANPDAPAA